MTRRNRNLARFVFLLAVTLILEMIGLPQPFTGPMVNMMLILTTLIIGPSAGIGLGILTPTAAVLRGQLPAPLAPMVPFIAMGNALLVLCFTIVRKRFDPLEGETVAWAAGYAGLLLGAVLKTTFLFLAARYFLPLLLGKSLPAGLIGLMSLPQFITAMIGGTAGMFLYRLLQSRGTFLP